MDPRYLTALAEPTRLRIVELLRGRPSSVNEIAKKLDLSQPQTSKHLKYLTKAGIVAVQPLAQQRIYALHTEPFKQLKGWASSFEQDWNKRLDNLDTHLRKLKKG